MISSSNKKRGLGDSKYNERRSECETALAELQKVVDIKALGELTEEQFEAHKDAIKEYADKEKIKMNEPLSVLQVLNYCMGLK